MHILQCSSVKCSIYSTDFAIFLVVLVVLVVLGSRHSHSRKSQFQVDSWNRSANIHQFAWRHQYSKLWRGCDGKNEPCRIGAARATPARRELCTFRQVQVYHYDHANTHPNHEITFFVHMRRNFLLRPHCATRCLKLGDNQVAWDEEFCLYRYASVS